MNKDTQFLLERIDENHREVLQKIDALTAWKNKVHGISVAISALVSGAIAFLTGR